MSASEFVDLFGKEGGAERYASFRPEYPKDFIASIVAKCLGTQPSLINFRYPYEFYLMVERERG